VDLSDQTAAVSGKFVQFGDHIDTLETVDRVFKEQRKLSFSYGAAFFGVTLAIPALSVWVPGWYETPFCLFLWTMAWTYSKQADKLDEKLMHIAEEIEAKVKAEAGDAS
jgi:hypothetical protein